MSTITGLNQSLFVNKQDGNSAHSPKVNTQNSDRQVLKPVTLEADFIQAGNEYIQQQADDIFTRANEYTKLSDAYSPAAQEGLRAYSSIELAAKREAVSLMMGVDIYA